MENKPRENSIKSLSNIYTVVIGVAVSIAVAAVIDRSQGLTSVTWCGALLFLAFIVTLLPFCHGALRHLDNVYFDASKASRAGAFVFDFALLFFHAIAFVVLAVLIKTPSDFSWALVGVLTIDVVWAVFAHFTRDESEAISAPGRWAIINLLFVAIAIMLLIGQDIRLGDQTLSLKVSVVVFFGCVVRTLLDYVWCRSFYFPK